MKDNELKAVINKVDMTLKEYAEFKLSNDDIDISLNYDQSCIKDS